MQLEAALDKRVEHDRRRRSAQAEGDNSAEEEEQPLVGLLLQARDENGVRRLLHVFHATGDLRALHQLGRVAVARVDAAKQTRAFAARRMARSVLSDAFGRAELRPTFDALYFELDQENAVDRQILHFFAELKLDEKKEQEQEQELGKDEL